MHCPDFRKAEVVEKLRTAFIDTHRVIDLDGARIYFETLGLERGRPVVVCLNGTGQCTLNWRSLARRLSPEQILPSVNRYRPSCGRHRG